MAKLDMNDPKNWGELDMHEPKNWGEVAKRAKTRHDNAKARVLSALAKVAPSTLPALDFTSVERNMLRELELEGKIAYARRGRSIEHDGWYLVQK